MNQLFAEKNCSIICDFFLIPIMFCLYLILIAHSFYIVIGLFNEEDDI